MAISTNPTEQYLTHTERLFVKYIISSDESQFITSTECQEGLSSYIGSVGLQEGNAGEIVQKSIVSLFLLSGMELVMVVVADGLTVAPPGYLVNIPGLARYTRGKL